MPECCDASGYPELFDEREARRRLREYERKGLDSMAASMVGYMKSRGIQGRTILEAGGGIGAIQVELLEAGAANTINVELSGGYETVARELLESKGLQHRVVRRLGDFTELSEQLTADDVVMNRVICCYPFMERLVGAAVASSRRFVAATFPRDHLVGRVALFFENGFCRIRGVDFRSFIHPPAAIEATATARGFDVVYRDHDFMWSAVVFERI